MPNVCPFDANNDKGFHVFAFPQLRLTRRAYGLPLAVAVLGLLAGCDKPAPRVEEVRPVRAITLAAGSGDERVEFSGDVRARYESRLAFRVGGKIVERKVDVGAIVKDGQVLMRLDPQDLRLAEAQARATLRAAETERDLAQADYKRHQNLRAQNFVSQAVLDAKQAALRAAQANVDAARAGLRGQSNQAGYANLASDTDGVVTAVDAEVGQVVSAGAPVVRVARTDEKEVVIGIPEDRVEQLRQASEVSVRLWANRAEAIPGKIREVAPVADPATRTYTVKVSIPPRPDIRLGMTATVEMATKEASDAATLRVPLSALVQDKGATSVWLVEKGRSGVPAVQLRRVQVAGQSGNDILLSGGVQPGQTVVTAGVHLLKPGQKVRILTADVSRRGDTEAAASGGGQ
ncbi:efflux RND transporter periplasmic adaptor subunit [Massilia sp. IC2-477]|uniref:efflux RND transporter periplasmic adaptor subunit n=1 Tax=Massilia sp. IC2-477 TaxID=2887198 RepID=UPI001D112393|nr:efflux RND transporter periplasmic adaptor subunit [Massilia sp. IC2-477]MCC2955533.1 efflux RND transporter periplasmic adaptor subunit [Massilia sp. IC2-477]